MTGELVLHEKITDELGNTIEMKIWRVPAKRRSSAFPERRDEIRFPEHAQARQGFSGRCGAVQGEIP
jgi:hypothetical protein